jgi:hypothetical protein
MTLRHAMLSMFWPRFKRGDWLSDSGSGMPWEDGVFIRSCCDRMERGDLRAWDDFMARFAADPKFARVFRAFLDDEWWRLTMEDASFIQSCAARLEQGDSQGWHSLAERCVDDSLFAAGFNSFLQTIGGSLDHIRSEELNDILVLLRPPVHVDETPATTRPAQSAVMYIERKAGNLTGPARIGRVTFSKTGKTIYYRGRQFRSLKGRGFKSNYVEVRSGEDYWISRPRRDGRDRLYGERTPIEIDDEAREEYWPVIRRQPDDVQRKVV